jgi:plasmid maintenance system antidote protein VapI
MKPAQPKHPDNFADSGPWLKRDVLPSLGPSVAQAAIDRKVTWQTLHCILARTAATTPEMALIFERLTDIAAMIWFELQEDHNPHRAMASALPR